MPYSVKNDEMHIQTQPIYNNVHLLTLIKCGDYSRCGVQPSKYNAKQKHLGCKKGEANQKQQLSDYKSIHSYTCN